MKEQVELEPHIKPHAFELHDCGVVKPHVREPAKSLGNASEAMNLIGFPSNFIVDRLIPNAELECRVVKELEARFSVRNSEREEAT